MEPGKPAETRALRRGAQPSRVRAIASHGAGGWPLGGDRGSPDGREEGKSPDDAVARPEGGPAGEPPPRHPRYEILGVLGWGGQGIVYRAFDRELRREVALKTLRCGDVSPRLAQVFADEARAAAALEHPNIIPIYDVTVDGDGRPFYTMRLVTGRSLHDELDCIEESWTRGERGDGAGIVRLAQVVQQAARALQCAHDRGVLHRDVKPSNILLGKMGEVLVVDWGIAKFVGRSQAETTTGVARGTPFYMSPEQARGEKIDARSDVYALGVLLYEALTLRLPFHGDSAAEVMAAILRDVPLPIEDAALEGRPVPPELGALTMCAIAREPRERVQTASEFEREIQAFLEGVRDRERRLSATAACRAKADEALTRHCELEAERERLLAAIPALEAESPPWKPVAEKRALLDTRRRIEELQDSSRAAFLESVNGLTDALAHLPDHAETRRALADLFWPRFLAAEEESDRALAQTYRLLVERFHDGRFTRDLQGDGSLDLAVLPRHAELMLHPLVEKDLVLVDGPGRPLGFGSVKLDSLPMGSYVVVAEAQGFEPARYPVFIGRNTAWKGELRLLKEGSIPRGFVYIPGTEATLGGDPLATNAWPRRRVRVESFLIGRHPVTFGDYCEFLEAMEARGESARFIPRLDSAGELCSLGAADGRFAPNVGRLLCERTRGQFGDDCGPRIPVIGVDHHMALSYATWAGARHGRVGRLPTGVEREFVSRGVDERTYPWGSRSDPALFHTRESFDGAPDVAPVGSFPEDRSVHGVNDLAGCTQEWTQDPYDGRPTVMEVRGGAWSLGASTGRGAWRGACSAGARNSAIGVRVLLEINTTAG